MELTYKSRRKISLLYGLVTLCANLMAAIIPINCSTPKITDAFQSNWQAFLETHRYFTIIITVITFSIPSLLCMIYASNTKGNNFLSRFVNFPFAFSLLGITGWIFYFLVEFIILIIVKTEYNINITPVLLTSSMYIILEALFSFTLSFFIMDSLHRNRILPRYFPQGELSRIKGTINPSIKLLFINLYISVVLFPLVYLLSTLFTIILNNNLTLDKNIIITFGIIVISGIFIFVIFSDYFDCPLKRLQKGVEQIKNGDLHSKVRIITNDSFGVLADTFNEMSSSIEEKTQKIYQIQNSIITGMATMVESRDNSTGGHIKRTSECVKLFISEIKKNDEFKNLPDYFCADVIKAAPMHDLGKIAVDDSILRKPGKFTDEEYEKMKKHSEEGVKIIENVLSEVDDDNFKNIAINIAHYHHEKYNGQGYPDKLKGAEIPLEARIMALADVFDALVSKRCYKDTFSYDKAFSIIQESLGSHFDPKLGKIFIDSREKFEMLYSRI
ncbi:MAG: HD domain-containing protein [Spirochaetales bacterium]|nr:HD domain-containing protein [Spirochaetales bacterium]MDY5914295.1 HD domain-containing protein [Treponema sp.]